MTSMTFQAAAESNSASPPQKTFVIIENDVLNHVFSYKKCFHIETISNTGTCFRLCPVARVHALFLSQRL